MGKDIKIFLVLERSKFSSAGNRRKIYLSIYDNIDVRMYVSNDSNEIERERERGKLILFVFALTTDSTLIY